MKSTIIYLLSGIFLASFALACGSNAPIVKKDEIPAPTPILSDFEKQLNYVRNGNFKYIFALRRSDGKSFDKEDTAFIEKNTPEQTNQKVKTDDGKRVVIGSNFEFFKENFAALLKKYEIEDFSGTETGSVGTPITKVPENANTIADIDRIARGEFNNRNAAVNSNANRSKIKP